MRWAAVAVMLALAGCGSPLDREWFTDRAVYQREFHACMEHMQIVADPDAIDECRTYAGYAASNCVGAGCPVRMQPVERAP